MRVFQGLLVDPILFQNLFRNDNALLEVALVLLWFASFVQNNTHKIPRFTTNCHLVWNYDQAGHLNVRCLLQGCV